MLLISLQGARPGSTFAQYERIHQLFVHGYLEKCQSEAEREYRRSEHFDPVLARKFQLLEAEAMLWRGLNEDAYKVLSLSSSVRSDPEDTVRERTLEGVALDHLQRFEEAQNRFSEAERLCAEHDYASCSALLRARGVMSIGRGNLVQAHGQLLASLASARRHEDKFAQAIAFLNLGVVGLQTDHFDEALDWSNSANKTAISIGAEDLAQAAVSNLGWAYFKLGDSDRALLLLDQAAKEAIRLGDPGAEIGVLANAAYIYQSSGDQTRATRLDLQILKRANDIGSKEYILNTLEDLAHLAVASGDLNAATKYIEQVTPLIQSNGNRLDQLDIMLAQGAIAAAHDRDAEAEQIFTTVEHDPAAEISMKLDAEKGLASLFERRGDTPSTDRMYRTALNTFESARDQLRDENSKLPFFANATGIYDDYVHFLISRHRSDEALLVADQSRARMLAQGRGTESRIPVATTLHPSQIAQKTGATLLFYWLGPKQSYLWAITSTRTSLYDLPPKKEIGDSIERYRKSLLGFGDPLENSDPDGRALYEKLLAPASASIKAKSGIIVLSDGGLSRLNFETLIVSAPRPHYFIEDATISSAPSLQMLASSNNAGSAQRRLLLIGDAISPGPDYPNLPMASTEMQYIQHQVGPRNTVICARERATPAAYLTADPRQFGYIHFVAHGVASPTDPLDSAIILSRSSPAEDSFKLHARDIIQHPIRADLVTISACYGTGARSFAGEGSVGLAWAFLRAGAHNVIGALWEVSDESAPRMMSDLYRGLNSGLSPSAALREAKLALLHSNKEFRKPFYWAPLQVYTGR